jgi:hypothetical protein
VSRELALRGPDWRGPDWRENDRLEVSGHQVSQMDKETAFAVTRRCKMKTEIFNTYEDFLKRKDKKVNGVSPACE